MNPTSVELLILDVDGVLTDGGILMTADGEREKRFHVQDGCAIKLWQRCGKRTAIVSGRDADAVRSRASELGINWVHTGVSDKLAAYEAVLAAADCNDAAVGYIGDDLPDLRAMCRAGFPIAVANAVPAVKRAAAYVTRRRAGYGAIAEVVEFLLRKQRRWSRAMLMEM